MHKNNNVSTIDTFFANLCPLMPTFAAQNYGFKQPKNKNNFFNLPTYLHKIIQNPYKHWDFREFLPTYKLHYNYILPTCFSGFPRDETSLNKHLAKFFLKKTLLCR